jgi:hypothetical protein
VRVTTASASRRRHHDQFANGDGNDVFDVNGHDVDFAISGYSLNDVVLTQQYGQAIVNFKGSGDSLTFNLGGGGSVRLSFSEARAWISKPDATAGSPAIHVPATKSVDDRNADAWSLRSTCRCLMAD